MKQEPGRRQPGIPSLQGGEDVNNDPRIENLTIRLTDVTALGHCVRGSRRWFEHYGFDFKHVIAHGVSAKALVATGDAQALAVVRAKLDSLKGDE